MPKRQWRTTPKQIAAHNRPRPYIEESWPGSGRYGIFEWPTHRAIATEMPRERAENMFQQLLEKYK